MAFKRHNLSERKAEPLLSSNHQHDRAAVYKVNETKSELFIPPLPEYGYFNINCHRLVCVIVVIFDYDHSLGVNCFEFELNFISKSVLQGMNLYESYANEHTVLHYRRWFILSMISIIITCANPTIINQWNILGFGQLTENL